MTEILRRKDFTAIERKEIDALGDMFSLLMAQKRLLPAIGDNNRPVLAGQIKAYQSTLNGRKEIIHVEARRRRAFKRAGL